MIWLLLISFFGLQLFGSELQERNPYMPVGAHRVPTDLCGSGPLCNPKVVDCCKASIAPVASCGWFMGSSTVGTLLCLLGKPLCGAPLMVLSLLPCMAACADERVSQKLVPCVEIDEHDELRGQEDA